MLFDEDYSRAVTKYLTLRGPSRKRAKTMCKSSGHKWSDVTRDASVWPYKILVRRVCEKCGKRMSARKVTL